MSQSSKTILSKEYLEWSANNNESSVTKNPQMAFFHAKYERYSGCFLDELIKKYQPIPVSEIEPEFEITKDGDIRMKFVHNPPRESIDD